MDNLEGCLQSNSDSFLQLFASYYLSNKYLTKENLIKSVLTMLLGETTRAERTWNEEEYIMLDQALATYLTQVKAIPESNASIIDIWNYVTGDIESVKVPFETYLDLHPSEALKNCLENGTQCDVAKAYAKELNYTRLTLPSALSKREQSKVDSNQML